MFFSSHVQVKVISELNYWRSGHCWVRLGFTVALSGWLVSVSILLLWNWILCYRNILSARFPQHKIIQPCLGRQHSIYCSIFWYVCTMMLKWQQYNTVTTLQGCIKPSVICLLCYMRYVSACARPLSGIDCKVQLAVRLYCTYVTSVTL